LAIIDWYSRYIVGFGLSNTLEKAFVIETINKAIKTHGNPEVMNSDQGSQFTSQEYIDLLKENSIKISMDGKGRALDNQRMKDSSGLINGKNCTWKNAKTGHELRLLTKAYIDDYNNERPHQSLNYQTPAQYYYGRRLELKAG